MTAPSTEAVSPPSRAETILRAICREMAMQGGVSEETLTQAELCVRGYSAPEPRGKEPPHCPSCNCGEHILGPPETKEAKQATICPNCDAELPNGCGGVFKSEGESCALNWKPSPGGSSEG